MAFRNGKGLPAGNDAKEVGSAAEVLSGGYGLAAMNGSIPLNRGIIPGYSRCLALYDLIWGVDREREIRRYIRSCVET